MVPLWHARSVGVPSRNRQDLWMGVLGGLAVTSCFVRSFDELALVEAGAGADEGDQVGCVHGAPACPGLRT